MSDLKLNLMPVARQAGDAGSDYEKIRASCEFRSLPQSGFNNCFHPGLPHVCRCDEVICGKLTMAKARCGEELKTEN